MKHLTIAFRKRLGNLPCNHWIVLQELFGDAGAVLRVLKAAHRGIRMRERDEHPLWTSG